MWNGKSVLVTGAGGFIGSHLTEQLVELGANVKAMVHYNSLGKWGWLDTSEVRSEIEVITGDICDRDSVRYAMEGAEVVFHLAALIGIPYSYYAPESYVRTNIGGTLNVLQASRELNIEKVIHTSTSEVYGSARYVPIDEMHPLQGQSPYSATKIGADKLAEAFHLSFGLPVATVRPFNVFGPRQSERAVIPTIITQVLIQQEVRLGNLETTRDFSFVLDTVDGFLRVAESPDTVGRVINIGSGAEISIGDLTNVIMEIMGRKVPILSEEHRMRPKDSEVERLCADNNEAKRLAGWSPKHGLKKGLEQTIKWVADNLGAYRPGNYTI